MAVKVTTACVIINIAFVYAWEIVSLLHRRAYAPQNGMSVLK